MGENSVLLPTFKGDGLQPGVTPDDMGTVYDRMERLDRDFSRFPRLRWQHPLDQDRPTQNPK